ncbi:MAG: putative Ig domain-containing protein [Longimicrobiales bacterium]
MSYGLRSGAGPESRPSFGHGPRFDPVEAAATTTGPGQQSLNPPTQMGAPGRTSLFWENTVTGQRFMWLLQGTTVDQGGSLSSVQTRWTMDASADMTGDGLADILWTNHTTGERYVWYMSGLADIGGGSLGIVGVNWLINGVGDFNGDNKADIVWTNTTTGERYIWYMDGMTNTGGTSLGVVPVNWEINAVADMTGDGRPELIWTNTNTGERYVWYMNGVVNTGGISLGVVGTQWEIVGATDLTGDGNADLIWQDTTTGQRYIWYMDGVVNTGGVVLEQNSTDWDIAAVSIDPPNSMPDVSLTTLSLPTGVTGVAYAQSLVAAGGDGNYAWSITSGALPPGLTLNPNTGLIAGIPELNGTFHFTAQVTSDGKSSSRALSITISGPPNITTNALPIGINGMAYNQTVVATGGNGVYGWAVTVGSLPTGLTLHPTTGAITGTPTVNGTFNFTVQVTSNGLTDTQALSIQIVPPPDITTVALPDGVVGVAYNQTLLATGGDGSYAWAVTAGSLPNGLVLNAGTGAITGTPTGSGTSNFTVQVTSAGTTDTQALSITVAFPPPNITTTSLPAATQNSAYNQTVQVTGGNGVYAWTITAGSLPTGLALGPTTGAITGTPTGTGLSNFTVQVTSDGVTDTQALSINVVAAGAVWFQDEWNYADRTALEAAYTVNISPFATKTDGDVRIVTGLTGTPGGFTRALEMEFNDISGTRACGYEPGVGIGMPLPNAAVDQPSELWIEVPVYLAPNYTTSHGCGSFSEHKFLFLFDQAMADRWNIMMGSAGDEIRYYPNSDPGGVLVARQPGSNPASTASPRLDIDTELVGKWVVLRIRSRLGSGGTGVAQMWIDGVLVLDDQGLSTNPASNYFNLLALGANSNHRPASLVTWRYGPVKVYINDPGW